MAIKESNDTSSARRRLAIYVRPGGIDALVIGDDERRLSTIEVDAAITSPAKVLEEAVYVTPWLLGDFAKIDVVASSRHFTMIPDQIAADEGAMSAVAETLWPDAGCESISVDSCGRGATLLSVFDRSLSGFVSRTFTGASLHHRLASLVNFFSSLSRPVNRVKLYACFSGENMLDIVAVTADGLLMANTFECQDAADAVYYIMASVKDCGLDALDDEIVVCGDATRSAETTETLRRYLNSVMPLLLPAEDSELPVELISFTR